MKPRVLITAFLILVSACAHSPRLVPESSVPRAQGKENVALAEVAGVRVQVAPDAWKRDPSNLSEVFTPLHLVIENASGHAVRVSYADFALTGANGFRYAAIPPLAAKGTVVTQVAPVPSRFYADGFFIADHYWPYYPRFSRWAPFPFDPLYFDQSYSYWPQPLPTRDMIAEALPEGAIQDRGRVAGFLYFQSAVTKESRVLFDMSLVDASNGQSFGQISIPFTVRR